MLDEKKINEIKSRIPSYIRDGIIKKDKVSFTEFLLNNAKNSLDSAKLLFEASTNNDLKDSLGFPDFNGFLWVINSSYYSIFYTAKALLENNGIKIKTDSSIHSIVFDALVYYFYLTGKLQKKFVEDFAESKEEAAELLGKEKATEIINEYFYEKEKRGLFTYEMGLSAMQNKASTSLKRAKRFNVEIRRLIET